MLKNKNAQITWIIATAIFIFIISAFTFYVTNYFKPKNPIEPLVFERASIENYIDECVKKTAEDGLKLLGKQGGLIITADYLTAPNLGIVYLYNDGNKIPSMDRIQNELSFYMNDSLNNCLKNLDDFKKQGWNAEKGNINIKTQINQEDVFFEVDFPLKVSDKGNTINFEKFAAKLNVRLKYIYNLANTVVDFNAKNPGGIDRTALSDYDVNVTIFPYQNSLIYVIDDYKSVIMNQPYRFIFALRLG
ncbi:MAG: hypothetical protein Q8R04_00165 [Nanoarchaeota archaeon]|nr:hypothetical protein [Nanoarchaeota archaeon]